MSLVVMALVVGCSARHAGNAAPVDPDLTRDVGFGAERFDGQLEVGETYAAFGVRNADGEFRIVASRYAPDYFRDDIVWRNEKTVLVDARSEVWHSVTFDVVMLTESAVEVKGELEWVPQYECDVVLIKPASGAPNGLAGL